MTNPQPERSLVDEQERKGGLVVRDRPQVAVELAGDQIEITVSRIADDFRSVETTTITFPAECGRDIARAILQLLKR